MLNGLKRLFGLPILIGKDTNGNAYYEVIRHGMHVFLLCIGLIPLGITRRWVKMKGVRSHIDYDASKIPGTNSLIRLTLLIDSRVANMADSDT